MAWRCKSNYVHYESSVIKVRFRLVKIRGSSWGRLEKRIRLPAPEDALDEEITAAGYQWLVDP